METRLPTAKVIVSMMHVWGCVCFDSRQCFVFPRVKLLEHVETLRRRNLLGMSVMATAWTGTPGNACWNINIQLSTITQIQTNTIYTHREKKHFQQLIFNVLDIWMIFVYVVQSKMALVCLATESFVPSQGPNAKIKTKHQQTQLCFS